MRLKNDLFKNNLENLENNFLNKIKSANKEGLPDLMNQLIKKPELKYSKNENFLNSLLSLYKAKIADFDWDWVYFYKQFYFLNKREEINEFVSEIFFKLLDDLSKIRDKIVLGIEDGQKEVQDFESLVANFNFLKSRSFFESNKALFEKGFNNLIKNNHLEEARRLIGNYLLNDIEMTEFIKSENVLPEIGKKFFKLIEEGNFYWVVRIKKIVSEEYLFDGLNFEKLEKVIRSK